MEATVGSFEAKMHLSRLLDQVQKGKHFIITKRGTAVARLIPFVEKTADISVKEIMVRFRKVRESIEGTVNVKELIEDGRKY